MKKFILATAFIFGMIGLDAQSVTVLVGSSPFQDSLWTVDTTTLQIKRRLSPTPSSGGTITGMTALTKDPSNGDLYIVCKQSATTGRTLGKLNLLTGVVTIIGNLGDNFSSLTFTSNARLFGATGDGAAVPEALYSIDKTNATKTLIKNMGSGADGEVICANPDDNNMLYHWSGNGTVVFEKFDTLTGPYTPTNIPIIGTTNGETFGAVYMGNNKFWISNISSTFNRINANGTWGAQFGSNPDDLRGLAFMTCSRAITGNASFCTGGSTLLTHGSSTAGATYQWFLNGASIVGATTQTYTATAAGHYNCLVSDECTSNDSSGVGINVIVNPLPVVSVSATASSFCAGDSTQVAANAPSGTYQWYQDGVLIPGATTSPFTITSGGVFNMICTDVNGCSDSSATGVTVTVNPLPVVSVSATASSFCAGDSTQVAANAPSGTYQWYQDGVLIPGATTSPFTITSGGVFNMICTDVNGCSDSSATGTTVIVNPLPVVDLGNDTTVCGSLVLDAGNAGSTYLWSDSTTAQTLTVSATGNYSVTVTDTNGCASSASIGYTAGVIPSVTLFGDTSQCGGSIVLDAGNAGSTYLWIDSTTAQTLTVSTSGIYSVVVTSADGCTDSDTVNVTINTPPTVSASAASTTVCQDDANVTLTGTPAGGTFSGPGVTGNSFDPSIGTGTQALTYSFTDGNGCSGSAGINITVNACVGIIEQQNISTVSIYPKKLKKRRSIS
ncbi:MAG: hypothetical protein FD123_1837 [Bacteroidetes bacterium]|nr:MAG: hypothetical protein FD123_1837 [Bacteroidota bacterium]